MTAQKQKTKGSAESAPHQLMHVNEATDRDFARLATPAQLAARERQKNVPPANVWQTLRRLLNCNKAQLAARLGVSPRTLRLWETAEERGESAGKNAHQRAAELLQAVLRAAECDQHAQWRLNWNAIATIGGRK